MKVATLVLLSLITFAVLEETEDYTPEENEKEEVPELITLFESPCAYTNSSTGPEGDCVEITLNPNYQVEVLLPVTAPETNKTFYVPFLIRQKQKVTSFSKKALGALGVRGGDNITIIDEPKVAVLGDENILGIDILNKSLLAIDFFEYEAGIAILSENGTAYVINWPLEAFKNKRLRRQTQKMSEGYRKLLKKMESSKRKHAERLEKLQEVIEEREDMIDQITAKIEALMQRKFSEEEEEEIGNHRRRKRVKKEKRPKAANETNTSQS